MLKAPGHRTQQVSVEQAYGYGMLEGPSLVQQIRAKNENEKRDKDRTERREARERRRERRRQKRKQEE